MENDNREVEILKNETICNKYKVAITKGLELEKRKPVNSLNIDGIAQMLVEVIYEAVNESIPVKAKVICLNVVILIDVNGVCKLCYILQKWLQCRQTGIQCTSSASVLCC